MALPISVYPGTYVPGAETALHAAVDTINSTWEMANIKTTELEAKVDAVTDETTGWLSTLLAPHITAGQVAAPVVTEPSVTIPSSIDTAAILTDFTDQYTALRSVQANDVTNLYDDLFAKIDSVVTAGPVPTPQVAEPTVLIPQNIDTSYILAEFTAQYTDLRAVQANDITTLFNTYFPDDSAMHAEAAAWIRNAVASGKAIASPTVVEPNVLIPNNIDTSYILAEYKATYTELRALLVSDLCTLFGTYFPDDNATYTAAETWLRDALASGKGIPTATAAQLLTDDKDRITADAARAADALSQRFAAQRFPLMSGQQASATLQLQQKLQEEVANSSRKIVVMSVEQLKWTVEKMLGLRELAMKSAIDYIKVLASAPDSAAQVVGIGYDAQTKLINAAASYLNARTEVQKLMTDVAKFNVTFELQSVEKMLGLRELAVQSSLEYSKTMAMAPETASKVVGIGYDAQTKLISAVASYLNARTEVQSLANDAAKFNVTAELQAIEKMLELRKTSLTSAVDYAKALTAAPDTAAKVVGIGYDAQTKLISSAAQYYNARTDVQKLVTDAAKFNVSTTLDAAAKNQATDMQLIEDRLNALLTEIKAFAQIATSLFNNLHANAGTGYNVSVS